MEKLMNHLKEHLDLFSKLESKLYLIKQIADAIIICLESGGKVLIFGNGGSAADAQHFAAELVGKYKHKNNLPVISLATNTSIITAIGNDFGFEYIFEEQVKALGKKGDIAIGISTSGKSENVLRALKTAKKLGLKTIGIAGEAGMDHMDILFEVPSGNTPRIQEAHEFILHNICELVDAHFGKTEGKA